MTANQSRLLGVAILVSLVSLAMHMAREYDDERNSRANVSTPDVAARGSLTDPELASARTRLAAGAYVAKTRQLTGHQSLVEIVIPESYSQELDTRCIVYQDTELATSTMDCSGPLFRHGQ